MKDDKKGTKKSTGELAKRVVTAVIGASAIVGLILYGGTLAMMFLVIVISMGMLFEYSKIVFSMRDRQEKKYLLGSIGLCVVVLGEVFRQYQGALIVGVFLALFLYFLGSAKRRTQDEFEDHFKELALAFFGLIYLTVLPVYLLRLYESDHGAHWCLLFLLTVWGGDTSAYFVGTRYGKHRLYLKVSPKKSWEGSVGGLLFGTLVAVGYKFLVFKEAGLFLVLALSLSVGVVAQMGDLCESFFKRAFDQKDSGTTLPGHGGFLDRFDGVVLSLPVAYGLVHLFS